MSATPTPTAPQQSTPHGLLVQVFLAGAILAAIVVYLVVRHDSAGPTQSTVTTASTSGSGAPASQSRSVGPFTAVELTGVDNVVVRVGSPQSVTVHADANLLQTVTTVVRHGRLVIGTTGSFSTRSPTRVTVSTPTLDALALSGAGTIAVTGVRAANLAVTLTGSGTVRVQGAARDVRATIGGSGAIYVPASESLDARVSGSGAIFYSGSPTQLHTSITGSGTIAPAH